MTVVIVLTIVTVSIDNFDSIDSIDNSYSNDSSDSSESIGSIDSIDRTISHLNMCPTWEQGTISRVPPHIHVLKLGRGRWPLLYSV